MTWVALAAVVGLSFWALALAKRGGWRRHLRFVPVVCAIAWLGTFVTDYMLANTFKRLGAPGIEASARQRMLSQGIARSMWPTLAEICILAGVFVVLLVAHLRADRDQTNRRMDQG